MLCLGIFLIALVSFGAGGEAPKEKFALLLKFWFIIFIMNRREKKEVLLEPPTLLSKNIKKGGNLI
jgi:hypothetical protein